jgi:hypothetical protein
MGIGAAIVGSAAVGLISGSKSASAQKQAAQTASDSSLQSTRESIASQEKLANQARADLSPWKTTGEAALSKLWAGVNSGAFDVGTVDVTKDPSYAWRMSEGVNALDKSAASRGRLLSGAQQQGVADYAQNLASTEYSNAYARQSAEKTNQYNMLNNLSNTGQSAAAGQAAVSQNLSSSTANTLAANSVAQQNSAYQAGNARAGAYNSAATSVNQGIQNWLTYKAM